MLWFVVQLKNRAFGIRGKVHTELAGLDQNPGRLRARERVAPGEEEVVLLRSRRRTVAGVSWSW